MPSPSTHSTLLGTLLIAFIVAVGTANAVTPEDVRLTLLSGAAPVFAGLYTTRGWTWAVTGVYLANILLNYLGPHDYIAPVAGVGIFGGLVLATAALLLNHYLRVSRDAEHSTADFAETLTRAVQPHLPIEDEGVRICGFYVAATEGGRIGGDFYDAVPTPYGYRVMIGDVQGKGLPAISASRQIAAAFHEAAHYAESLPEVAYRMEQALLRDNARSRRDEQSSDLPAFATALLIEGHADGTFDYLSAGHVPFYRLRDGQVTELAATEPGLPLGLGTLDDTPRVTVRDTYRRQDAYLLVTDGVDEARDRTGAFFPLSERLAELARLGLPAETLVERLDEQLRAHVRGTTVRDDTTALVAHFPGAPCAAHEPTSP
ncbi:PP2C family protein-serine/threonine phosphatase [Streptomyces albidoflavus]